MTQHDSKIVLVTGASSGIGRELALEGARRGEILILVGRDRARLSETMALAGQAAKQTFGAGHEIRAETIVADLADPVQRQRLIDKITDAFGRLDILFNNAGKIACGSFEACSAANFESLFAINVATPAALVSLGLPLLRRSGNASIVNIGSMFGDIAFPRFAAYSATKFALRGLSDALRRELAAEGIRVIYAAPRATATPAAKTFSDLVAPMGMKVDGPDRVAARIWKGIDTGKTRLYPGLGERLASIGQALFPQVFDRHLSRIEQKIRCIPSKPTAGRFPKISEEPSSGV